MPSLLGQARRRGASKHKMQSATIRDFGGGLNTIDNDINLSTRYAVVLDNIYRGPDGSFRLRFGTDPYSNVSTAVSGDIIDGEYFNQYLIVVTDDGELAKIDDDGNATAIFNTTIAAALPGAPSGWSTGLTECDFVFNRDKLIIHNGIDKPLQVNADHTVEYLADPATGSNVNTPIGRFGCTVSNYHVVAHTSNGVDYDKTTLYISSTGAAGVFPSDPAPNDSISLDVGSYVSEQDSEIIGVEGFRNNLIVFFRTATLVLALGEFDGSGNHTPQEVDSIPRYGLLNHRMIMSIENDLLFADRIGVSSFKRNVVSLAVETKRESDLIAPGWQALASAAEAAGTLSGAFCVHDRLEGLCMFFVPDSDTGDMIAYSYRYSDSGRIHAWSRTTGWNFVAGCSTERGRVFFFRGSFVYRYGNTPYGEETYQDFCTVDDEWSASSVSYSEGDQVWYGNAIYEALQDHTSDAGNYPGASNPDLHWSDEPTGDSIDFVWELPWIDVKQRAMLKKLSHMQIDTQGTGAFTLKVWVDNLYKNTAGEVVHDPVIDIDFIGGNRTGYGGIEQSFGGGRRTRDERLWSTPVKCKIFKARIEGSANAALRFIAITILYVMGSYRR